MKYTLGIISLGIVTIGAWWIVKESLKDIKKISKDPMPEDEEVTPEQLEELREKFRTHRC